MVDYPDIIAAGEFVERSTLHAPSGGLFLLVSAHSFPRALARLRPSAARVRIRSRSTSVSPSSTASIKRPVLVPVSAHGSAKDRNFALASTIPLDDAEQVEGASWPRACARSIRGWARLKAVKPLRRNTV